MIQQETITDRQEWRITPQSGKSKVFIDFDDAHDWASSNKGATVEVRSILEIRITSHWEVKS